LDSYFALQYRGKKRVLIFPIEIRKNGKEEKKESQRGGRGNGVRANLYGSSLKREVKREGDSRISSSYRKKGKKEKRYRQINGGEKNLRIPST